MAVEALTTGVKYQVTIILRGAIYRGPWPLGFSESVGVCGRVLKIVELTGLIELPN